MNNFKWSAPPQVGDEVIPHDCGQSMTKEMERMIGKQYKITDEYDFNNYELNDGALWHSNHLTPANWHFCNDGSARAMRCVKAMNSKWCGLTGHWYGFYKNQSFPCGTHEPTNSYLCDLSQAEALLGLEEWGQADEIKSGDLVEGSNDGIIWHDGLIFGFKKHAINVKYLYVCENEKGNTHTFKHIRPAQLKQPTMEEEITLLLKDKSFHVLETCKLIANDIMQIIKRHESK